MRRDLTEYRYLWYLSDEVQRNMLTIQEDAEFEELRVNVLKRRDVSIVACSVEIVVSVGAIALYDLRRSLFILAVNAVLAAISGIGLHGALTLNLRQTQIHGVITTGLIIATLMNFVVEATLVRNGFASEALPTWLVLVMMITPYFVNLVCSSLNLWLCIVLSEYQSLEEEMSGLLPAYEIEQNAARTVSGGTCCVCMDNRKDAVLVPCGHRCLCVKCGDLLKSRRRTCPICRATITSVVRVHDS